MSGKVVEIHIRKKDRTNLTKSSAVLVEDHGFEECEKAIGDKQISLASSDAIYEKVEGLCTKRFFANVITDGIRYDEISEGDMLKIGDAKLVLSGVGKHCYNDCPLNQAGKNCLLSRQCAFAKVIHGGTIECGQPILLKAED